MKKLVTLALSAVMVMGMSVASFATDDTTYGGFYKTSNQSEVSMVTLALNQNNGVTYVDEDTLTIPASSFQLRMFGIPFTGTLKSIRETNADFDITLNSAGNLITVDAVGEDVSLDDLFTAKVPVTVEYNTTFLGHSDTNTASFGLSHTKPVYAPSFPLSNY